MRSFRRCSTVGADRCMRTAAEPRDACARQLTRRRLEMPALDALDRIDHDAAAALQVVGRERLLAVLLQPGRVADAEDVLAHPTPHPVLWIPEGQEARLKRERLALVVHAFLAGQVVERELHVMELRAEVHVVCEA